MTTALVLGYSAFDLGLFSDKDPRLKLYVDDYNRVGWGLPHRKPQKPSHGGASLTLPRSYDKPHARW